MAMNQADMVRRTFAGISAGDVERATQYIDAARFVQHNPYAVDGVEGLRQFVRGATREQLQLEVVRLLEDGAYVVAQGKGRRSGRSVFFDVFRFEDDLVVEHWAFAAEGAGPNRSGHTQEDGPTEPTGQELAESARRELTEANKTLVREYYEQFHLRGDHSVTARYFDGDRMIRHEPGVEDGVGHFLRDVERLMQQRTIDSIALLLGERDLVFLVAKGTYQGNACVYVDLYRVKDRRIVEHWGFPEAVPSAAESRNANGMV